MSKQTATQYLIEEIKNDSLVQAKSTEEWNEVFRKALQMEREQIIDAYTECWSNDGGNPFHKVKEAEQFYNERYGGNK
jgi:hypothetical protein